MGSRISTQTQKSLIDTQRDINMDIMDSRIASQPH